MLDLLELSRDQSELPSHGNQSAQLLTPALALNDMVQDAGVVIFG